jgi:hypothetical protein
VLASSWRTVISIGRRVGLSFVCLLLADALFSLILALWLTMAGSARISLAIPVFRVAMIFALPVWCVWLPIVIATKDAEGRKIWTILLSGILVGPASIALWSLILLLRGANQQMVWHGDPLLGDLGGGIACMIFALIVGLFTKLLLFGGPKGPASPIGDYRSQTGPDLTKLCAMPNFARRRSRLSASAGARTFMSLSK